MSAALIKPFLLEADRRRPHLKIANTAQSCFELLQLTLALAGPEWAFVGKTRDMDGASVTPAGFSPLILTLTRPDGQLQTISIVGLSMDAAFHVPSRRQVKVIANSSANDDPNPDIHGPAKLDPYDINPQVYRWHNPPIPQFGRVADPWTPTQPPASSPAPAVKPRGQFFAELTAINDFYAAPEGLQRPGGMVKFDDQGQPIADVEALGAWGYDLMTGKTVLECLAQIRNSDEWKGKHR